MAARAEPARLLAPAKLTLSLRITGTRHDGYHLIDAEMVTLDLCDELVVHPSSQPSVEIVTLYDQQPQPAEATISNGPSAAAAAPGEAATQAGPTTETSGAIPTDRSNLVLRALELAGRTAHVEVRKRIPPGSGLGGGSADAAAVLRWANRLAAGGHEHSGTPALITPQQAATLGADVPFCLVGGRARVTGIGEIVEPLPFRPLALVLWTPPIHVDTARVYRVWDELGGPAGDHLNDLEPAALVAYPELAAWRDQLAQASGRGPQLAGSGGTWFVPGPIGTRADLPVSDGINAIRARSIEST